MSDSGKKYAACTLANNQRINLPLNELEMIEVPLEVGIPNATPSRKKTMAICEICKIEYNQEDRKGMAGKIT